MRGIVSIDAGTTSMRAILFDERGRILAADQRDNPPRHFPDGRVEQSAATWKASLESLLAGMAAAALGSGLDIACLSLTSQRSSVIPVDADGEALHPAIMWQDQRTEALCRELSEHTSLVYKRTGLRISPVFSAIKMTWFRRHAPEVYRSCHKMLGVHDYLLFHLTGDFVTDRSLASRTNLLNLETGEWDGQLLDLFGIDSALLCRLVDPGTVAGRLNAAMARLTGLPEGIPVVSAGGDQQCAALGMGLLSPGQMVANTGTGSYVIGLATQPVFDTAMRLSCNVSAVAGRYIVEAGILSSGALYGWFRDQFFHERGANPGFDLINEEAGAAPPGAHGVTLLPHFKGAGSPHWNPLAKGLFFGLSLGSTRGDMARAVLEGIAAEMAESIELIEALTGKVSELRVSGGLTNSALYNQIQADLYGRRVLRSGDGEATARGAWLGAAVALGLYPDHASAHAAQIVDPTGPDAGVRVFLPNPEVAQSYGRLRDRARGIYAALDAAGVYRLP